MELIIVDDCSTEEMHLPIYEKLNVTLIKHLINKEAAQLKWR